MKNDFNRRFCVAPMMDWTDRHCRYFHRLMSKNAVLYTEMVSTGAILFGDKNRHLDFDPAENPVAVQLGGSNPQELAECAVICQDWGYDEINLNVGCPSDRVQNGRFGACLMASPEIVAECVAAMQAKVHIPVTVKSRIGIDDQDSFPEFLNFVDTVASAGCRTFIVHARKAWLKGLSPKENREKPPLKYSYVTDLKKERPHLEIVVNGGIVDIQKARELLEEVDGVMMGREAYSNPWILSQVDRFIYGDLNKSVNRALVLKKYLDYVQLQKDRGVSLHHLSRHIIGLFQALPGARKWRRHISENVSLPGAGPEVLEKAAGFVRLESECF